MKKLILFILALSMILGAVSFVGCESEDVPETTEALAETAPETEPIPTSALIFDKDTMYFTVVRSTYAGTVVIESVKSIVAAFREKSSGEWNTAIKS